MTSFVSRLFSTAVAAAAATAAIASGTGCSSSSNATETPSSTTAEAVDACDAIDLAKPAAGKGQQFQIELSLAAGQEQEVCQLVKVDEDLDLNWSDAVMTTGSHHGLVQRTTYNGSIPATALDGTKIDGTKVHDCQTPSALWSVGSVIANARYASESPSTETTAQGVLPPNVAFKLKKDDYVVLNFHMLNASSKPLKACYKANLNSVPDAQVTAEAGSIFWYNVFPTVPANGTATARMACPITKDIQLASGVSHAHRRLVNYEATLLSADPEMGGVPSPSAALPNGLLFQGTNWDNPVANVYGGIAAPKPVTVKAGQWIDYHCDYKNPENRNVAQGFQTTDEMCMFIGTYWPRDPVIDTCNPDGTFGQSFGGHVYGDGTKNGADFLRCIQASPQMFTGGGPTDSAKRYATLSCISDTCPKASVGIAALLQCLFVNNKSTSACKTELSAVSAATCD